jgi:hypothetical protein
MAGEKRVSAFEKRPCDIANFLEINDLATVSLCLPVAEFRAAGSGSAAEFGKGFKSRFCMHITLPLTTQKMPFRKTIYDGTCLIICQYDK